ncbi:MAG: nodulation protein NfeD [Hyphomicrobiales bacterium]|nr:nodulation protein NfeD [Hyphomicrobiales bacterium]
MCGLHLGETRHSSRKWSFAPGGRIFGSKSRGATGVKLVSLAFLTILIFAGIVCPPAFAQNPAKGPALTIAIDGAIGPATARYVKDGLDVAAKRQAEVVILRLNTPGGLVTSMREIIADVLVSSVRVIGFVAPSGAHAASAGTYILYATHIAAMAPGTNLGAATPVDIGLSPSHPEPATEKKDGSGQPSTAETLATKATNDAVAFIRSLAELRGRNAEWAEEAVRKASSLSASAALQAHVIDLVARDQTELLEKIDGRKVEVAGRDVVLATKGLPITLLKPGWFIRLLSVITDPNIALILMLVGVYGLIFEFTTPGMVAPGTIGAICLLLALYALNLLPIDYAGLALMLLGVALLAVEAFSPTVAVGLGGIVAFLLGAAMLFKAQSPGFELSWMLVGIMAALLFGLSFLVGRYVWTARRSPARVGAQAMSGTKARVLDWSEGDGHVLAHGERWRAQAAESFAPGEIVEIASVQGLTLNVRHAIMPATSGGEAR